MNKLQVSTLFFTIALASGVHAMNTQAILDEYTTNCSYISKAYIRATINTMAQMLEHNNGNHADAQIFETLRSSVVKHAPYVYRRKRLYKAAVSRSADIFKAWLSTCKLSDLYEYKYDEANNSLLHLVCGSPESDKKMQALIDARANTRVRNKKKQTPLEYAQEKGDAAVQALLAVSNTAHVQPAPVVDLTRPHIVDLTAGNDVVDLSGD